MLDWWTELPWWLRLVLGVVVLLAGAALAWASVAGHFPPGGRRFAALGVALIGLGLGMLLVGGKSSSERKGYHF